MNIKNTRVITGPLSIFDLSLGITAVFLPGIYMSIMHSPAVTDGYYMLQRTGCVWLFFSLCEGAAFFYPQRLDIFIFLVGMLRFMDVPADVVYLLTSSNLTSFGKLSLIFSPIFNITVGTILIYFWNKRP